MMSGALHLLRREFTLALSHKGEVILPWLFFFLAAALFPLALGPDTVLLARLASGLVWVVALLATLLSLDRLFLSDYEDGNLDLIALSPYPLELVVLIKIIAHWLLTGLPLALAAPLIAISFGLTGAAVWTLTLTLLLGTPTLSLIGAIGAALTLGARRGGVLIPLLIVPLYIPVLLFGVLAGETVLAGLSARPHLLLLGAGILIALFVSPLATAAALRQALE